MSDPVPAKDRGQAGAYYPTVEPGRAGVDRGTRAQATLWLMRHGHRDVAVMLGLLPDGGAV